MACTNVVGSKSYLYLVSEDIWGVNPFDASGSGTGSQQAVHIPVTSYGVKFNPENRQANPYLGIFDRKHNINFRGMPGGTLVSPMYGYYPDGLSKSIAQYLMEWAFDSPTECELPSKTAYWAEGPSIADKEHNGLRVNSATLTGSDDSGMLELSLDLMGRYDSNPSTGLSAVPNDREKLVDMEYHRTTMSLGGVAITPKSFTLARQHNLQVHYLNSFEPTLLVKTQMKTTLQVTVPKNSNTYDAYRRLSTATEMTGQIVGKGLHNGTGASGTLTTMQIDFARLSFINVEDQGGKDDVLFQNLNFEVLKPDTSTQQIVFTWGVA